MLFKPKSIIEQRQAIIKEMTKGQITSEEAGRRLLSIDPDYGAAYLFLAQEYATAEDPAASEELYWKGLALSPCSHTFYLALIDFYGQPDEKSKAAHQYLLELGLWKLSFAPEVPDIVAEDFTRRFGTELGDFHDPEIFTVLATTLEVQRKNNPPSEDFLQRLLPYTLLNDLQNYAPTVLLYTLPRKIIEERERCLPVWQAALREWADNHNKVSTEALAFIIALIGEMAGPEALDDLLELSSHADEVIFAHVHWAIWRIGQKFPAETLSVFRAAIPSSPVPKLCALAEQMNLLGNVDGVATALPALLEDFTAIASHTDAPFLLLDVASALVDLGLQAKAGEIMARYEPKLGKAARKQLRRLIDDDAFSPKLLEFGFDSLDIEEVCVNRALLPADEDEEDGNDFDEDDDFEAPPEPVLARPKPGRNDPCWCGSGKKYKKCHLAADEEADRGQAQQQAPESAADSDRGRLVQEILAFAKQFHPRAAYVEANRLYFDQEPEDVDPESNSMSGFFEWYLHDFRPAGSGPTALEEFLRRRGPRLSSRERSILDSWRNARLSLFEVQSIKPGVGVELEDAFAGDKLFVHDVSSSRTLVRWDYILNRVEEFEGRFTFSGNGLLVPRSMARTLISSIEDDSRKASLSPLEYIASNSHSWHRTLQDLHRRRLDDLRIMNAEGDPMEFSAAVYEVLDQDALVAALLAVKPYEETTAKDHPPGTRHFGWLETGVEGPRRSFGTIQLAGGQLRLECNSRRRLTIGRQLLEKNASRFLKHLEDSFKTLESLKQEAMAGGAPPKPANPLPPEVAGPLILRVKAEHYAKWPDEPLPALDGKTPREAVESVVGRRAVLDLLRTMENGEERNRQRGQPVFDFSSLRAALGLDHP